MERVNDKAVLDAITARIFQFVEAEGLSYADFAGILDIGQAVLSHMKKGRNKVSLNVYAKILDSFPNLNPDWLLLGQGSMYRSEHNKSENSYGNLFSSPPIQAENKLEEEPSQLPFQHIAAKKIKKIVVFYDDNSFEELMP